MVARAYNRKIEMFSCFNANLASFGAWLQQLFAESEGKDQKGMFVCSQVFSTDLHSVGQFLQQGSPIFAETFLLQKKQIIPGSTYQMRKY
jgi:glucose-6-phosphate isomerase